jgi:hypothetical protein
VNKGEERIAFEAQLVHAVITANAPLKTRLRHRIAGEALERRCIVWGTFRGEDRPHEYESPPLGAMLANRPKRRDGDGYGGSPLWDSNPEVQLAYWTYRQWCRLYASEVLLGVYTPDELDDGSAMVDVTPAPSEALRQRLRDAKKARVEDRGFDADHVGREAAQRNTIIENEETTDAGPQGRDNVADDEGRQDDPAGRVAGDRDESGSGETGGVDPATGIEPAGQATEETVDDDQSDIFPPDRKPPKGRARRGTPS